MRAETSLVDEGSWELVPGGKGTTVDTSDLVVTESVAFVFAHESLHTKEVQIPLIGIPRQITDFETRVGLASIAVTVSPPSGSGTADTADSNVGTNVALGKGTSDLVNVRLDLIVATMGVVVATMLRRNSNLEECEKCNQHGHHALGFAEVGHIAECNGAFCCKRQAEQASKKRLQCSN